MKNLKAKKILKSCLDELQSLDKQITNADVENSHRLRTHGILRATGSIETSCRIILSDALVHAARGNENNSIYQHIRELTPEINILTIKAALRHFNTEWSERFDKHMLLSNKLELISAFHSLTDARVKLYSNNDTQLALNSIVADFKNAMHVMEILDEVVLNLHNSTSNFSAIKEKIQTIAAHRELQSYASSWNPLPVSLNG